MLLRQCRGGERVPNELMIPNYKNVWANIRRIGHTPGAEGVSFKSIEYPKDL